MYIVRPFLTMLLHGGGAILLLFMLSCKHAPTDPWLGDFSDYAMVVKYDTDVTQFRRPEKAGQIEQMTNMEKLSARPRFRRSHVEAYLRKDGSSAWIIKDLGHPADKELPKLSPPSDLPKIVTTRVANGKAQFFDQNDKLISEQAMDMTALNQVVAMIVDPSPKKALANLGLATSSVNTASSTSRSANLVTYSQIDSVNNLRKEITVDTDKNYLVETNLYDANNNLMHRMDFDYVEVLGSAAPMVERILQTNRDIGKNGIAIITEIITNISNLSIEDFLNP